MTPLRVQLVMRLAAWLLRVMGAEVVYIVAAKRRRGTVISEWMHQRNRIRSVTGFVKEFWSTVGDDAAQHFSEAEIHEMVGD